MNNPSVLGWRLFALLLALYLLFPYVIEKHFYFNELFSLLGFVCFLKYGHQLIKTNSFVQIGVVLFLLAGLMQMLLSPLLYDVNVYGYLRNSEIAYSSFVFYLGIYFFSYLERNPLPRVMLPIAIGASFFSGVAYLFTALLPGMVRGVRKLSVYYVAFLLLLIAGVLAHVGFSENSGTLVLVTLSAIAVGAVAGSQDRRVLIQLGLSGMVLLAGVIFYKLYPSLVLLWNQGFAAFFDASKQALGINDANSIWRFGLWMTLVIKHFPDWLIGIGFGTHLFPTGLDNKMALFSQDPYYQYTVGAHNSFVTILMRMGVVAILGMLLMYYGFYRGFIRNVRAWVHSGDMLRFSTAVGVVVVTIHALFNVVIESPIYSSAFWLAWGMFFRASSAVQPTVTYIMSERDVKHSGGQVDEITN